MKNKYIAFIFTVLLFFSTLNILSINSMSYQITGNHVVYENEYGKIDIFPHTSTELIRQVQYCNITWYKEDTNLDFVFIFDYELQDNKDIFIWKNISHEVKNPIYTEIQYDYTLIDITSFKQLNETPSFLDYGDIPSLKYYSGKLTSNGSKNIIIGFDSFSWLNSQHTNAIFYYHILELTGYETKNIFYFDWLSIKNMFTYQVYNDKHCYICKDITIKKDKQYILKFEYNSKPNENGKWDMLIKRSSDSLYSVYHSGKYVSIDPWYDSNWKYVKKVIINKSKIGKPLLNFKVLFDNTTSDFAHAQADGDDFIFLDSTNVTVYKHEIENFSSNRLIAWVNVTYLSNTTNTTLWLYYGNPSCSNQQQVTGTWGTRYKTVHHLKDLTTSTTNDSTISNYDGTKNKTNEPIEATGKILKSQSFDNVNDYITLNNTVHGTGAKTVSFWSYLETDTDYSVICGNTLGGTGNDVGIHIGYDGVGNQIQWRLGNGATGGDFLNYYQSSIKKSCWNYNSMVYDGTDLKIYLNGTYVSMDNTKQGSESAPSYNMRLGGSNQALGMYRWVLNGKIDEFRIINGTFNASFLLSEFYNQNSPSTFLSVGNEIIGNHAPINSNNSPLNSELCFSIPTLSIYISDIDNDTMNNKLRSNFSGTWVTYKFTNNTHNTTITYDFISVLPLNKTIYWSSNTTDNNSDWDNDTYSFWLSNVSMITDEDLFMVGSSVFLFSMIGIFIITRRKRKI